MQNINPDIFKAYDIRGVYPDQIDGEFAYRLGGAFCRFLINNGEAGNRKIIMARDTRLSSDELAENLIQGITDQSFDVADLGLASAPLFYWAIIKEKAAGGLMVTASHNPAQYNGFKVCRADSRMVSGETGLFQIRDLMEQAGLETSFNAGKISQVDLKKEYLDFMLSFIKSSQRKPLKIVYDCANGTMGQEIEEISKLIPGEKEILFADPDGNFPNHEPNPIKPENMSALKNKIIESGADLGIAFDGDGDRIVFYDEKGEMVRGDFITALMAEILLKQNPGKKILSEVRSSRVVNEIIRQNGGIPVLGKSGHSLIKEHMRRENIFFGGEMSGHYFFQELGYIDSSLLVAIKILELLSREDKKLSRLVAPLKKYSSSGELNFEVADPDGVLMAAESHFKGAKGAQVKKIDGLTIEFADWWFNLRKSNTEPLVRLNMEADSPEILEEKRKELEGLICG